MMESSFMNSLSNFIAQDCDSYIDTLRTPTIASTETSSETQTETYIEAHGKTTGEILTHLPSALEYTPIPTWNGEWADEAGLIVKYDDIPKIGETHFPLQTDYIRTSVLPITVAANIGIGIVVMISVIIISVHNYSLSISSIVPKS
jgi:hypothetical protein